MRIALVLLLAWPLGLWWLYVPFRCLRSGSICYRGSVYERERCPFWFWFYAVASGVAGAVMLACGAGMLLYKSEG